LFDSSKLVINDAVVVRCAGTAGTSKRQPVAPFSVGTVETCGSSPPAVSPEAAALCRPIVYLYKASSVSIYNLFSLFVLISSLRKGGQCRAFKGKMTKK